MKKQKVDKKGQLFQTMQVARQKMASLSNEEKTQLEKGWDIEHAYYSSVLEGSKKDRKEFEELGEKVA